MLHFRRIPAAIDLKRTTPKKAGAHCAAREMFPVWPRLRDVLKGLCLADPWIPAFAGMEIKTDGT